MEKISKVRANITLTLSHFATLLVAAAADLADFLVLLALRCLE